MSEVMLQQTQVARVLVRYEPFLERFPTVTACATEPVAEVIAAWAGLGYNRRAVALHRCARAVVARHGAAFPAQLDELQALPGIGPYTARALLAFAFERDVAVVDTNVARVLARQAGRPLTAAEAQAAADELAPPGQGWAWNQAMLDFGATVCTKRAPHCDNCPVHRTCAWHATRPPELVAVDDAMRNQLRQVRDMRRSVPEPVPDPVPDPAASTALVSARQSRFDGSDRQGRGRLLDALRAAPVPAGDVAGAMGWPDDPERAIRVARTLVADGLASTDTDGTWRLGHGADPGGAPRVLPPSPSRRP